MRARSTVVAAPAVLVTPGRPHPASGPVPPDRPVRSPKYRLGAAVLICALLALATSAAAECAWVLWSSSIRPNSTVVTWDAIAAFAPSGGGQQACGRSASVFARRAEANDQGLIHRGYLCLPEAVDPRSARSK